MGGVLGAFAVSLLGSIYARLWNGYAFAAMVPGVLLLVPVEYTAFSLLLLDSRTDHIVFHGRLVLLLWEDWPRTMMMHLMISSPVASTLVLP